VGKAQPVYTQVNSTASVNLSGNGVRHCCRSETSNDQETQQEQVDSIQCGNDWEWAEETCTTVK